MPKRKTMFLLLTVFFSLLLTNCDPSSVHSSISTATSSATAVESETETSDFDTSEEREFVGRDLPDLINPFEQSDVTITHFESTDELYDDKRGTEKRIINYSVYQDGLIHHAFYEKADDKDTISYAAYHDNGVTYFIETIPLNPVKTREYGMPDKAKAFFAREEAKARDIVIPFLSDFFNMFESLKTFNTPEELHDFFDFGEGELTVSLTNDRDFYFLNVIIEFVSLDEGNVPVTLKSENFIIFEVIEGLPISLEITQNNSENNVRYESNYSFARATYETKLALYPGPFATNVSPFSGLEGTEFNGDELDINLTPTYTMIEKMTFSQIELSEERAETLVRELNLSAFNNGFLFEEATSLYSRKEEHNESLLVYGYSENEATTFYKDDEVTVTADEEEMLFKRLYEEEFHDVVNTLLLDFQNVMEFLHRYLQDKETFIETSWYDYGSFYEYEDDYYYLILGSTSASNEAETHCIFKLNELNAPTYIEIKRYFFYKPSYIIGSYNEQIITFTYNETLPDYSGPYAE